MVTHIDTEQKLVQLKQQLGDANMGICMSADTVNKLAMLGIPRNKLCFVNPPPSDHVEPRKTVIGITSRCKLSGCKREYLLVELASFIDPSLFKFRIMGAGWERVVATIRAKGFEVDQVGDFSTDTYWEVLRSFDYYMYLGEDEGSMGFLDALVCGVPTIATPQGFHLDAVNGISHAFHDIEDLTQIFVEISSQRRRLIESVSAWTWTEYARKHLEIWKALLAGEDCTRAIGQAACIVGIVPADQCESPEVPHNIPLPQHLPLLSGPGGGRHRPRVLLIADHGTEDFKHIAEVFKTNVEAGFQMCFNYQGQAAAEGSYLTRAGWEFKALELRSHCEKEILCLSRDFDAVLFYDVVSPGLIKKLRRQTRDNYTYYGRELAEATRCLHKRRYCRQYLLPIVSRFLSWLYCIKHSSRIVVFTYTPPAILLHLYLAEDVDAFISPVRVSSSAPIAFRAKCHLVNVLTSGRGIDPGVLHAMLGVLCDVIDKSPASASQAVKRYLLHEQFSVAKSEARSLFNGVRPPMWIWLVLHLPIAITECTFVVARCGWRLLKSGWRFGLKCIPQ